MTTEFYLFLPQMRMSLASLAQRAQDAERAGFAGITLMDHLVPPGATDQPMHEAFVAATWIAAHTQSLRIGHLVLCEAFRHPVVLARQAIALDQASGGRFDLGIGSGSVPAEFERFGIVEQSPGARVRRLRETLEVLAGLWSGPPFDYQGEFHQLHAAQMLPLPLVEIPVLVGGTGPRTMAIAADLAQWCNIPVHQLDRLDDVRARAGQARVSLQQMVAFIADPASRQEVTDTARRRFGTQGGGLVIGDGQEMVDHFSGLAESGIERFYVWFADFARPETLAAFGHEVIGVIR
jgi:alkanesulfonate monooxygenase SsuD/methylene tetrahydromethanopterin reductase-like flavin-dependent oxidoreductase (luciferase family)